MILDTVTFAPVVALSLLVAAAGPGGAGRGRPVPAGTWGGQHIEMEITEQGAYVEFDCAHGTIAEALRLDGEGRFDGKGTYVQERPGPQREGDEREGRPVRYRGRVDGKTMTLTVTPAQADRGAGDGEAQSLGRFTLALGRPAVLRKCL